VFHVRQVQGVAVTKDHVVAEKRILFGAQDLLWRTKKINEGGNTSALLAKLPIRDSGTEVMAAFFMKGQNSGNRWLDGITPAHEIPTHWYIQ